MEISLCMIVKDEENTIGRYLDSIKDLVDEIIIVDTGSSDTTREYAKSRGAKVFNFEWIDDFSKARNYSFSQATKDYILWMDANEILNENDIQKFNDLKNLITENSIDSVTMNCALNIDENNQVTSSIRQNRLVKRLSNFQWIGATNEYLNVHGNIVHSDITIINKKYKKCTDRNLKIYENLLKKNELIYPRDNYYFANELFEHKRYDEAIKYYEDFLQNNNMWTDGIKDACYKLSDCYSMKNDYDSELKYIFKSFEYDVPRADFCCKLAYKFMCENKLDMAIYWYSLAINAVPSNVSMSIIHHDTYTYIPWIQLCICHFRKGNFDSAYFSNEMAGKYKPTDSFVKHNRDLLKDKIKKDTVDEVKKYIPQ